MQAMHMGARAVCRSCRRHLSRSCTSAHLADAPILQYNWPPMNEFDLQGWEREIQAWRRRLGSQAASPSQIRVVVDELDDIQRDLGELRQHPESETQSRDRLERRLVRLLGLYDLACRGRVGKA